MENLRVFSNKTKPEEGRSVWYHSNFQTRYNMYFNEHLSEFCEDDDPEDEGQNLKGVIRWGYMSDIETFLRSAAVDEGGAG